MKKMWNQKGVAVDHINNFDNDDPRQEKSFAAWVIIIKIVNDQ